MLRSISFTNYRAFKTGRYPICPITIFVGQNSIGKTSALQIPLILEQTTQITGGSYLSAIKVQGRDISYGDPLRLFYQLNFKEPVTIGIEFLNKYAGTIICDSLARGFAVSVSRVAQHLAVLSRNLKTPKQPKQRLIKQLEKYIEINVNQILAAPENFFDALIAARDLLIPFESGDAPLPVSYYRTNLRTVYRRRGPVFRLSHFLGTCRAPLRRHFR